MVRGWTMINLVLTGLHKAVAIAVRKPKHVIPVWMVYGSALGLLVRDKANVRPAVQRKSLAERTKLRRELVRTHAAGAIGAPVDVQTVTALPAPDIAVVLPVAAIRTVRAMSKRLFQLHKKRRVQWDILIVVRRRRASALQAAI